MERLKRIRGLGSPATVALLALLVGALRLWYCAKLPVNTGDILRNIHYGLLLSEKGLGVANLPLIALNPGYAKVAWHNVPYHYPVVTLGFFALVAKISPTIFFTKLALTLVEALGALLLLAYSREKWLALLYWASPISIWWVSHEGQFEALQSVFVLGSLFLLSRRRPRWALLLLAFAVQVKVSALLMLPLFVLSAWKEGDWKERGRQAASFLLGFSPSLVALFFVSPANLRTHLAYNPYTWNFLKPDLASPKWLALTNQVGSYAMLLVLVILVLRTKAVAQLFAPVAFMVVAKSAFTFQFWYMELFQSFAAPIQNRRARWWLFLLAPLLDLSSIGQMLVGPFGYTVGNYYDGMTAFTVLHSLVAR